MCIAGTLAFTLCGKADAGEKMSFGQRPHAACWHRGTDLGQVVSIGGWGWPLGEEAEICPSKS